MLYNVGFDLEVNRIVKLKIENKITVELTNCVAEGS